MRRSACSCGDAQQRKKESVHYQAWFKNLACLKANVHTTVSSRRGEFTQACTADRFKQQTIKSGRAYFMKVLVEKISTASVLWLFDCSLLQQIRQGSRVAAKLRLKSLDVDKRFCQ